MVSHGLDIEDSVLGLFLCLLFYMVTSVFYTVMAACFMDYDFGNNGVCFVGLYCR